MNNVDTDEYAIVELFRGKTFANVCRYAIAAESVPTPWLRLREIRDRAGVSSTAFDDAQDKLRAYGLIERSSDPTESAMPRARIPASPPVELLRQYHRDQRAVLEDRDLPDGVSIGDAVVSVPDLMEPTGRAKLVAWYLTQSPDDRFSLSKLGRESPVIKSTARDHLPYLVDRGIVTAHERQQGSMRYEEYAINPDHPVVPFLRGLNEATVQYNASVETDDDELTTTEQSDDHPTNTP
jgi:hypothetical protein